MKTTTLVACCVACMFVGYVSSETKFDPLHPLTPARPDRPVVRFIARLAKLGLWAAMVAEPQPQAVEQQYAARHCKTAMICHAEGW